MSNIFWYYLFRYSVLFGILFTYLLVFLVFDRTITDDFENLQELDVQDFEQQLAGELGK
jgi:hypothetical protein